MTPSKIKGTIPRTVTVRPGGARNYPIEIGTGISRKLARVIRGISDSCRVLVVSDSLVAPIYLRGVEKGLQGKGIDVHTQIMRAGERYKTMGAYARLISRLAELDDARDLIVVALGGGVVGDVAGFAAGTYKRGITLVQVPTTLLACVDSSVGGKTAVDLKEGKNLVGVFHQPRAVVIDLDTLSSLPARELRAGMAEVIKYGFIMDAKFHARLARDMNAIMELDIDKLAPVVKRCCELKARVVKKDERDTGGARAILNFGHTFAHAIETACGYGDYRHGEAVGIGMVLAARLSTRLGTLDAADAAIVEETVRAAGLPVKYSGASPEELVALMGHDKKTRGGKLRFVLLDRIGHALLVDDVKARDVLAVLQD